MKNRITFIIPLALVLLSISSSAFIFWQTNRKESDAIRTTALAQMKLDITRLQNVLYNLVTKDKLDLQSARLNLSVTAMNNDIRSIVLTDEYTKVLVANRYSWEGYYAHKVSDFNRPAAREVQKSKSSIIKFSGKNNELLKGYYPVVIDFESKQSLPVKKIGVLYVKYSLGTKLKQAQRRAINQSLTIAGILILATLFVAYFMHMLISRRLNHLTYVAKHLSSGNLDITAGLKGNDELSELGMAFDEMVARLKRDIGRRKRAEGDLWNLNETLEHRIEQRTQELDVKKQELLDTQAIAHHTNKLAALGEMASGIAHEINSPLQAISLITYKLKRMDASAEENSLKDAAEKIDNIVKTVSNIIESLRRVSRSSSNEPYYSVQIKDIVNNVSGITRERYLIKEIDLKISYHENCENEMISCQQTQIAQVLINLLNNAYDAVLEVKDRWITLEVFDAGDVVKFVITDSGEGISKEEAEKIFEPMYTSKPIGEGTGLGLSISMDIVHQHNGSLILDQDSKHTRFILTIPKQHKAE